MTRKKVLYIRGLPRSLKDMFKAKCNRAGETMQDVIHGLMLGYIERGLSDIPLRNYRLRHATNPLFDISTKTINRACLFFDGLPNKVIQDFKAECALRSHSMQAVMEALIRAYTTGKRSGKVTRQLNGRIRAMFVTTNVLD